MKKSTQIIDFEIIWKKIHGTLTEEEEEALERWLKANDKHQRYFEKVQRFYAQGSDFDKIPVNTQAAWQKVMGRAGSAQQKKSNKSFAYAASIAACIMLLLVTYFVIKPFEPEPPAKVSQSVQTIAPGRNKAILLMDDGTAYNLSSGQNLDVEEGGTQISSQGTSLQYKESKESAAEVKYNTLVIPQGGQFSLTLADGTEVWLNAGTTLRYPTSFIGKERKVELTGEAYFEVTKNAEMPFRVLSGEQVVEVLGTSFNIASYQEDASIYTTLVEGKVSVFLEKTPQVRKTLLPEQQSVFVKGTDKINKRVVDVEQYIGWKDGWFYFKDESLESIMQTLSRWYDVEVRFKNEEAKKLQFTGKIKRYEDLKDVLNLLEKTNEVTFKIDRRYITVE